MGTSPYVCCQGGCQVFASNFADPGVGTDLGCHWDERSGDWTIVDNAIVGFDLKEAGTSGALVVAIAETASVEQTVDVPVINVAIGAKPRIVVNYLDDNNYHFVELEPTLAPDGHYLRFYRREGGINTLLKKYTEVDVDITGLNETTVCFSRESFTWTANPAPAEFYFVCNPSVFEGGFQAGLGNGAASAITFGGFVLQNYKQVSAAGVTSACCSQQCQCMDESGTHCIPPNLILTFTATGGCAALDGVSFPLTWHPEGIPDIAANTPWHSDPDTNLPPCDMEGGAMWRFGCRSDPPCPGTAHFMLVNDGAWEECLGGFCTTASVSCNPLIVVSHVVTIPATDPNPMTCGCCDQSVDGTYFITITEAV